MTVINMAAFAIAGVLLTVIPSCLPGLHVFNLIAVLIIGLHAAGSQGLALPSDALVPLCSGMMAGFSVFSAVPSVFLSAPDESAFFTVLPGQRFFRQGRGYEAVMLTAAGAVAGVIFICLLILPPFAGAAGVLLAVIRPHTKWIIWLVICFMLMSEWPQAGRLRYAGWAKFFEAWKPLLAGLVTFALSGCLGLLLFLRSPLPVESAFQNLMPAFVGIFTLPWLLVNIMSARSAGATVQKASVSEFGWGVFAHGVTSGIAGGAFAALVPGVTGGVGGFLAGHASAMRDDRSFLISQGASRTVYYTGGFALFFLPGMRVIRGGAASMLGTVYTPETCAGFYAMLGSVAVACAVSLLLLSPVIKLAMVLTGRVGHRRLSLSGLVAAVVFVFLFTGFEGLLTMLTAAGIGLIPVLYGTRRMNCLALILLPLAVII